jgi:hypothetical protein
MEDNSGVNLHPETKKEFYRSWSFWKPFLGVIIGGLAGFLYYHFVGCNSGSCAITSNPYRSMIAGGIFGFLMVNSPCSKGRC